MTNFHSGHNFTATFLYELSPFFRSHFSLSFENYKRYSLSSYIIFVVFFMRNPMNLVSSQSDDFDFFMRLPSIMYHGFLGCEPQAIRFPKIFGHFNLDFYGQTVAILILTSWQLKFKTVEDFSATTMQPLLEFIYLNPTDFRGKHGHITTDNLEVCTSRLPSSEQKKQQKTC